MDFFKKSAVALTYDFQSEGAPKILVKGKGKNAELIEKIALENEIPLKEDPELAGILSRLPALSEIPDALYEIVAILYLELLEIDREKKGSGRE
jgi:type III secretion system FlhB-like substrate exporter